MNLITRETKLGTPNAHLRANDCLNDRLCSKSTAQVDEWMGEILPKRRPDTKAFGNIRHKIPTYTIHVHLDLTGAAGGVNCVAREAVRTWY